MSVRPGWTESHSCGNVDMGGHLGRFQSILFSLLAAAAFSSPLARGETLYAIVGNSLCGGENEIAATRPISPFAKTFAKGGDTPIPFGRFGKLEIALAEYLPRITSDPFFVVINCTPAAPYQSVATYGGLPLNSWARGENLWNNFFEPSTGQYARILRKNPTIDRVVFFFLGAMPDIIFSMQVGPATLDTVGKALLDLRESAEEVATLVEGETGRSFKQSFALEHFDSSYAPVIQVHVDRANIISRQLETDKLFVLVHSGPLSFIDPIHYDNTSIVRLAQAAAKVMWR